jgi:hypothetical protein
MRLFLYLELLYLRLADTKYISLILKNTLIKLQTLSNWVIEVASEFNKNIFYLHIII